MNKDMALEGGGKASKGACNTREINQECVLSVLSSTNCACPTIQRVVRCSL